MLDTEHLNIISIISCFDILFYFGKCYHYLIYANILIFLNSTAETSMLYFIEYLQ